MSSLNTIRERILRANTFFSAIDGVVLTTFNINANFLEEQALPIVFGIENDSNEAKRKQLHDQLGATPCTVFYDPTIQTQITGNYRYVARPVPLRGRFFHPKLVILSGRTAENTNCIYLAVSSANLTISGWGRNAESFADTWIHKQNQQSHGALKEFLTWLNNYSTLEEEKTNSDAVLRVLDTLEKLPEQRRLTDAENKQWSGTLDAEFYASVVHTDGFPKFLLKNRSRRPTYFQVYSPYWGEITEQVRLFNAQETVVVPARRKDGAIGITKDQKDEIERLGIVIKKNKEDVDSRFWHMKAYWIEFGEKIHYSAVGSCNFTHAGLAGENGNVEAMLVHKNEEDDFPEIQEIESDEFAEKSDPEEEAPEYVPIAIVVGWDWRHKKWRWWIKPSEEQRDFMLELPGVDKFKINPNKNPNSKSVEPPVPPKKGAKYTVFYHSNGEPKEWSGQVVELNLDYSTRTYGRPLNANEILDSWLNGTPIGVRKRESIDDDLDNEGDYLETEVEKPATFDAVNLFDFYRAMRDRKSKLSEETSKEVQSAYLVGSPNSVLKLARLADQDTSVPVVRYLVLHELYGVMLRYQAILEKDQVNEVQQMLKKARECVYTKLEKELGPSNRNSNKMLKWFENKLSNLNREEMS